MGRRTLIAVLGAAVVGSTGGGLAALKLTSPRARSAHVAAPPSPPSPASTASITPTPSPPPAAPPRADAAVADPTPADAASAPQPGSQRAILATQMSAVLTRFAAWARDHAGAPCPDLATLGLAARDPWGHDLALTCTDQPADQMSGVRSAGPDAVLGTDDDVGSWTLGPEVTDLVRGPRWKPAAAPPARGPGRRRPGAPVDEPPAPPPPSTSTDGSASPPVKPPPAEPTGDDIPAHRSSR